MADWQVLGPVTNTFYSLPEIEGVRYSYAPRDGRQQITRTVLCPASQIDAFMLDFGGSYNWVVTGQCVNYLPGRYPGKPWLVVSHIHAEPLERDTLCGSDFYGIAIPKNGYRVTLVYETRKFLTTEDDPMIAPGTMVELKTDFGENILAVPTAGLAWARTPTAVQQEVQQSVNIASYEPTQSIDIVWHFVPLPPWSAISQFSGCVNDDYFFGFPPETVMFLGAQAEVTLQIGGGFTLWKLNYKFQIKRVLVGASDVGGWNHFFNPKPLNDAGNPQPGLPNYQRIVSSNTNQPIFTLVPMELLFASGTLNSFDFSQQIGTVADIINIQGLG